MMRWQHLALLAVAVACVSPAAIFARLAAEMHPIGVAFLRMVIATLILAPFMVANERGRPSGNIRLRHWTLLGLAGVALAVHFAAWVTSLSLTTVMASTILVTTYAVWVPVAGVLFLRERLSRFAVWGIAMAFLGVVGMVVLGSHGGTGSNPFLGNALAIVGALAMAVYLLLGRHLRQTLPALPYNVAVHAVAGAVLLLYVLGAGVKVAGFGIPVYAWIFAFALFPTIFGHAVINYLLKWVPSHFVSTSILLEPVVASLLAFVIFSEILTFGRSLAGLLVILGILVTIWSRERPLPSPENKRPAPTPPV